MQVDDRDAPWRAAAAGCLVPPEATTPMPSLAEKALGWQAYLSPSHQLNALLAEHANLDIIGAISQALTGDWESFSKAGDALRHLADWTLVTRAQIAGSNQYMFAGWSGQAADAAAAYFAQLDDGLISLEEALRVLSEKYDQTALGVYLNCDAAAGAIETGLDYLIGAGIAALAAAATSETGIGLVIGGAAAWWATSQAVAAFQAAVAAWDLAVMAAEGLAGSCAATFALLQGIEETRIPGQTFDSPRT